MTISAKDIHLQFMGTYNFCWSSLGDLKFFDLVCDSDDFDRLKLKFETIMRDS